MKIAVVTQIFPVREQPYRGHSVVETLKQMQRRAEVMVYSPQARYPGWLLPHSRMWARTDLDYVPDGIAARYFAYPAIPVLTRPINGWVCGILLERLLRLHPPDVMLSYWLYPDGAAALRAGRKLGVPVVVKAVGSDMNQATDCISRFLTRKVLEDADGVLTVSAHLRNKIIGMGIAAEKVRAVPNGCDTSVFHCSDRSEARHALAIPADADLILYVGRFDLAKGLQELLRAVADLVPRFPRIRVVLLGDGPARQAVEGLAQHLGIMERVTLAGPSPSSEVARWMAAATVCTLPSYREGYPNVAVEAVSCGRPLVATNVGGIPEIINESCGVLVPPHDHPALAAGLACALQRQWDSNEVASKMQRGWEQVAAETLDACSAAIAEKQRRAARASVSSGAA